MPTCHSNKPAPRDLVTSPRLRATSLFEPLAEDYERWSRWLSFGQDGRWRRAMVDALGVEAGSRFLDVAAGTGLITRQLESRGADVVALDQSPEMLHRASERGANTVIATGERLPFPDGAFDGLTFGYLMRYVDDLSKALVELTRVVCPGGVVGAVEFGRPSGGWLIPWRLYAHIGLPLLGAAISPRWREVGDFLGPSIEGFADAWPPDRLAAAWSAAGLQEVHVRRMSRGGGLVVTAHKP